EIVPNSDQCSIYTYMAGGGCSLPGKAMVLMPGAGYEGVTRFVIGPGIVQHPCNVALPFIVKEAMRCAVQIGHVITTQRLHHVDR
ncbi:L(+)-tartrate dehydratase subunit alpha, partial [Salmonella enterica subsp. enterica serovar Kentucky]|nr:L(+)-tartrate dehydratase subunit alpha [Salmonella enterica subsp. enterica serovar Kentucky]